MIVATSKAGLSEEVTFEERRAGGEEVDGVLEGRCFFAWVRRRTARKPVLAGAERLRQREGGEGEAGRAGPGGLRAGIWAFSLREGGPWMATSRERMGLGSGVLRCIFTTTGRTGCGGKGRIWGASPEATTLIQVGDDGAEPDGGRGGGVKWVGSGRIFHKSQWDRPGFGGRAGLEGIRTT